MFLSEDCDATNPARRIGDEGRQKKQAVEGEAKRKAEFDDNQAARKRSLDEKKLKMEEAHLAAQIKAIKQGTPEITIQSQLDVLFNQLKMHMERVTALDEAVWPCLDLVDKRWVIV